MAKEYLGYQSPDYATPFATFYNEAFLPLALPIQEALAHSPLEPERLPAFAAARYLETEGYTDCENGYTQYQDGSIHVAVRTVMPNVTPPMWDWWFGWHGCQDSRYKLWHPKAHVSARWEDGQNDVAYIGRHSIIKEYIGKELQDAMIQFQSPTDFGFSFDAVNHPEKAVYICARLGHPTLPVDYGYLVHQIRAIEGGSEMRSRFWVGGQYVSVRKTGILADLASEFIRKVRSLPQNFAPDLLQHCAEEMTHLAAFLPALYAENNRKSDDLQVAGLVTRRSDAGFDQLVMGTLFNKIDPGKRPDLVVEPKSVQDIIATLRYARSVGKKITVCSGGHSFSANHLRNNSVLILMKNFNQYEINADAMTAKAEPGVGGSVLMQELYKHNLFFPAGHCKGVCIGGYLLQGGYGWNGRKLGIACQSVIGLDIITADGELVHANADQHADLFWAARGAGPGFFGIVICFHLKLYPLPKYRAIIAHDFSMKHLEDVYRWAYEVGPGIPNAVEFQMIMSNNMLSVLGPGIEAIAPIFADTQEEYEEAMAFMKNSPIKRKAIIATPAFNPGIDMLYKTTMTHYPENCYWGVDNMWTHAPLDDLMPFIKEISRTLPPAPSHFLWLNWHPGSLSTDMAYSNEDNTYLALYGNWQNAEDTATYGDWAANMMRQMAHLSTGIQLADEGLHKRTAPFLSDGHLKKLQQIRAQRDPNGLFYEWHSRPAINESALS
ncbi:DAPG hydrolase family protein [Spirosoma panaciterrae]|uniref:DAPG hydrolase family protein n=1 Tax=Spirosoma panaciterrae TaxID=496058 RepID=UPI00037C1163|nr:FAD-binding protein [Spirosoma panaciterrae]